MELGNAAFGHSRGEWPVPREAAYEEPLAALIERTQAVTGWDGYSAEYDGPVFEMHNYWWGEDDVPEAERPNFLHKPTGLELRWYKYPLRDSYMSREVSPEEWASICRECVESLAVKEIEGADEGNP